MRKQEYQQQQLDHTIFFQHNRNGRKIILIVHIDDIILTGDNTEEIDLRKLWLKNLQSGFGTNMISFRNEGNEIEKEN